MNAEFSKIGLGRSARSAPSVPLAPGHLVVVGTGIQWAGQTTFSARRAIERADRVLFAVADPLTACWIRSLSAVAESLSYPRDGRSRRAIYAAMVERILVELRPGKRVCAAFYGSPAVLTRPAHDAIREARRLGHRATMLPGVSSIDCLFADLGIDPGDCGCHIFEAEQFLAGERFIDPEAHLILCQLALIGNRGPFRDANDGSVREGLSRLAARLSAIFGAGHSAVLYEAATHPARTHRADELPIGALSEAPLSEVSTLYVPPLRRSPAVRP